MGGALFSRRAQRKTALVGGRKPRTFLSAVEGEVTWRWWSRPWRVACREWSSWKSCYRENAEKTLVEGGLGCVGNPVDTGHGALEEASLLAVGLSQPWERR